MTETKTDAKNSIWDSFSFKHLNGDCAQDKVIYRLTKATPIFSTSPTYNRNNPNSYVAIQFTDHSEENEYFSFLTRPILTITKDQYYLRLHNFLVKYPKIAVKLPELYQHHPDKSMVILEDLGDQTLKSALINESKFNLGRYYEDLVHWIGQLQKIDHTQEPDLFYRQLDQKAINQELQELSSKISLRLFNLLTQFSQQLLTRIKFKLAHRDLQSRNIIIKDHQARIIDYQDICLAPSTYDLASLLYDPLAQSHLDCFERNRLAKIFWEYYGKNDYPSYPVFLQLVRSTAILRTLKSIARHLKLKSHNYQNIIQRALNVLQFLNQELKDQLEQNFIPELIRELRSS